MHDGLQGSLTHCECHIGHAMTAEVLADIQLQAIEHSLSSRFQVPQGTRRALHCLGRAQPDGRP